MIRIKSKGDFIKTNRFLEHAKSVDYAKILAAYGQAGCDALAEYTPKRTGKTAASWTYEVSTKDGSVELSFHNSNTNNGVNIAILIFYGHGTRNGGYVVGTDYINSALAPVFAELANAAWMEVTKG